MRALLLSLFFAAACGAPQGAAQNAASIEVRDGWVRETPGGVDVAAGYLTIANRGRANDRLVRASSPRAARIEVHEMSMEDGVMRMHAAENGLAVPAGATVTLAPAGRHLMFFDVSEPFAEGESIPVTLTFAAAGDISVEMPVRRTGPGHGH